MWHWSPRKKISQGKKLALARSAASDGSLRTCQIQFSWEFTARLRLGGRGGSNDKVERGRQVKVERRLRVIERDEWTSINVARLSCAAGRSWLIKQTIHGPNGPFSFLLPSQMRTEYKSETGACQCLCMFLWSIWDTSSTPRIFRDELETRDRNYNPEGVCGRRIKSKILMSNHSMNFQFHISHHASHMAPTVYFPNSYVSSGNDFERRVALAHP